jgi:putative ABC transport system permease protein
VERELQEELHFHIDKETEKNIKAGMDPAEARRVALVRFGGVEQVKEQVREERGVRPLEDLLADLRHALRIFRKDRGFALVVVLTLALGIGANSALFSVVNSVLLNPLPFDGADRLVFAWENRGQQDGGVNWVSLGNYQDWRRLNAVFDDMAAVQVRPYNLTGSGDPLRVSGVHVTAGLLPLLGVDPAIGRGFSPDEERTGAEPVCIVSYSIWQSRFGADPNLVGKQVILDGRSHTVVGVSPAGFAIPGFQPSQVFTPLVLDPTDPNFRGNHNSVVFARLRDGIAVEQANGELVALAARLEQEYPEWNEGIGATVRPAKDQLVQNARGNILVLFGAVLLVLLLSCVNLGALFLGRSYGREREMAVRAALGAGRGRLVRQVLTESLLLSIIGGALGLALCVIFVDTLRSWQPTALPRMGELAVDFKVLGFALTVSVVTGLLFGLVPALRSSRIRFRDTLSQSGALPNLGRRSPTQRALVTVQLALASVLLIGTGLLLRSHVRLLDVDPGFRAEDRIAMRIQLPADRYADRAQVGAFLQELTELLEATPGIRSAGASIGSFWTKHVTLQERPAEKLADVPVANLTIATPGYLETLGASLLRGRALRASDDSRAPFVALVNRNFAETHYGERDPIGRRIRLSVPDHLLPSELETVPPWYTIVGVVGDVRMGLPLAPTPEVVIPQLQDTDVARDFFVVAHADAPPADLASEVRQATWNIDPNQPVAWVQTVESLRSTSIARQRLNLLLVGAFGLTALTLAVMGVYGLMAHTVSARVREFGIRLAFGARPAFMVKQVVGQAVRLSVLGTAIGLALAFALTRLMASMLFGVAATDALAFTAVPVLLLLVAALASLFPALRAARLDPCDVLRYE